MWIPLPLASIQLNDYVRCETYTHSQKWLVIPGYEDYNRVTEGRVVMMVEQVASPADIMIEFEGQAQRLGPDPGSSGGWTTWIKVIDNAT